MWIRLWITPHAKSAEFIILRRQNIFVKKYLYTIFWYKTIISTTKKPVITGEIKGVQ